MQRTDRALGIALALLALTVLWTARAFPDVPGQKLGAGFLPMLVGAALLVCALVLVWRSTDARRYGKAEPAAEPAPAQPLAPALVVVASVLGYIGLADRLGFLLVAPLMMLASLRALGGAWRSSLLWAIGGTLLVHLAFYKLLRVPLPWGVFRPFY